MPDPAGHPGTSRGLFLTAVLASLSVGAVSFSDCDPTAVLDAGAARSTWIQPSTGKATVDLTGRVIAASHETIGQAVPVSTKWSTTLVPPRRCFDFTDILSLKTNATFSVAGTSVAHKC